MGKQRSVIMRHLSGANSLKTTFCLPLLFTEAISRLRCDVYSLVLSRLNLCCFSLISDFLPCFNVLFLDVVLLVFNVF